ncbi:hypothetical protein chiPu_0003739 [Chiloscyllium punctatum]|uniref:Uncharacterized protein n=1 Tax=Chiloscyllium punctatum TaxID=137246 RepID=A0A401S4Q9_CHIPU|nr:hypothetical protein [Chiloscyllium punctatum]
MLERARPPSATAGRGRRGEVPCRCRFKSGGGEESGGRAPSDDREGRACHLIPHTLPSRKRISSPWPAAPLSAFFRESSSLPVSPPARSLRPRSKLLRLCRLAMVPCRIAVCLKLGC